MPASLEQGSDGTAAAGVSLVAQTMAGERYRVALASSTALGTTESQAIGRLSVHGPQLLR